MAKSSQKDVIIISRHGKSALSRKIRLNWREYREWWQRYDAHGLLEGQSPKPKTIAAASEADIIISSTLRRARESARLVTGREPDMTTDLLIEAALPSPVLGPLKLRPKSWGTLSRIVWVFGYSSGMETVTQARARALEAAIMLQKQSAGGKTVFVAAHGWFNRMMGTQLRRKGWRRTENRGDLHWSYRRFERDTEI